jgi:hypothetical protein
MLSLTKSLLLPGSVSAFQSWLAGWPFHMPSSISDSDGFSELLNDPANGPSMTHNPKV